MLRSRSPDRTAWDRLRLIPRGELFHPEQVVDRAARCRLAIHLLRLSGAIALDRPMFAASNRGVRLRSAWRSYGNNALFADLAGFSGASVRRVLRPAADGPVSPSLPSKSWVFTRQFADRLDHPRCAGRPAQQAGEDPVRRREISTSRRRSTRPRSACRRPRRLPPS